MFGGFLKISSKSKRNWHIVANFCTFGLNNNSDLKLLSLDKKISMGNWFLTDFGSDIPGHLSFYTAMENKTIFYNNFFGFWEGVFPLHPLRGHGGILHILKRVAEISIEIQFLFTNWKMKIFWKCKGLVKFTK